MEYTPPLRRTARTAAPPPDGWPAPPPPCRYLTLYLSRPSRNESAPPRKRRGAWQAFCRQKTLAGSDDDDDDDDNNNNNNSNVGAQKTSPKESYSCSLCVLPVTR